MTDVPDFRALAELWLSRDPRSESLSPDEREKIVVKLAEALKKRREGTDHSKQDVGLVVNVPREEIRETGLSPRALDELARFLQERIEDVDEFDGSDSP